ncbi:MAG: hypothetical protein V3S02_01900 [Dehalococcoidales bacterium]
MKQISIEYCTRCRLNNDDDFLHEIAYSENRYLPDLLKKARQDPDSALYREAAKQMDERLAGEIEAAGEETEEDVDGRFRSDEAGEPGNARGAPRPGKEEITREDLSEAIDEYRRKGLLDMQEGKVTVTPRAVKKLAASALERILKDLRKKTAGSHRVETEDSGMELSPHTRPYEVGDDYSSVDIERTSINALRRCGELKFEPEDFEIHEEIPQSKLSAAIIIDESGSMRDSGKLEAAMETALALSRLILMEPDNILRIYVFSDEVKQIEPWEIVNEVISGGDTDIRAALSAFRRAVRHEYTDKQAYLITDSEPNNEDGQHIAFDEAVAGLLEEASRYRQEKIGLNIIMLDEVPELKSLASTIAKKNLGRVFFTSPGQLGEVLVEDYLKGRREGLSH